MESSTETLVAILDGIYSSADDRSAAVKVLADSAIEGYRSPSGNDKPSAEERLLVRLCTNLGAAVKLMEIGNPDIERIKKSDIFVEDAFAEDPPENPYYKYLIVAFDYWHSAGILAEEARPEDPIWWDQVIPKFFKYGYDSVGKRVV